MSLRCVLRRHNGLFSQARPSSHLKTSPLLLPRQSRQLHAVPSLGAEIDQSFKQDGVPELFSPGAFDVAWTQYQKFTIDRLNTILANDQARAEWDVKKLLINTARDPNLAPTFNYASMAHNNHFFFSGLSSSETPISPQLQTELSASFGSISAMRDTLLSTAAGMFGPGFVWLVQEERPSVSHPAHANRVTINQGALDSAEQHFRIVVTYLAGTPYPGAHHRQQSIDMNVQNLRSMEALNQQSQVQNEAGMFGRHSRSARGMGNISMETTGYDDGGDPRRFGGADVIPVLCVNTWQHCYLHDYGVAGKREYLARWWERINWDTVEGNTVKRQSHQMMR